MVASRLHRCVLPPCESLWVHQLLYMFHVPLKGTPSCGWICTPSNTRCMLSCAHLVNIPISIWIGSSVFAGLTVVNNRLCYSTSMNRPHLCCATCMQCGLITTASILRCAVSNTTKKLWCMDVQGKPAHARASRLQLMSSTHLNGPPLPRRLAELASWTSSFTLGGTALAISFIISSIHVGHAIKTLDSSTLADTTTTTTWCDSICSATSLYSPAITTRCFARLHSALRGIGDDRGRTHRTASA